MMQVSRFAKEITSLIYFFELNKRRLNFIAIRITIERWKSSRVRTQEIFSIFHSYLTIFINIFFLVFFEKSFGFFIKLIFFLSILELGVSLSATLNLNYLGDRRNPKR